MMLLLRCQLKSLVKVSTTVTDSLNSFLYIIAVQIGIRDLESKMSEIARRITKMCKADFLCEDISGNSDKGLFFVPGVKARQSARIFGKKLIGHGDLDSKRKSLTRTPRALKK